MSAGKSKIYGRVGTLHWAIGRTASAMAQQPQAVPQTND
jgi:hypothetical protein